MPSPCTRAAASLVALPGLVWTPAARAGYGSTDTVTVHSAFKRSVHTEVVVAAPVEEVWRELTDFAAMPSWSRSLQGTSGELRQGGHVVVSFMDDRGRVRPYEHDLVVYEEGRAFGWSDPIISGLRDHHIYRLSPQADGTTLFTQDDAANGAMSLVLGGYVTNFMITTYPVFNQTLRERVEARVKASAAAATAPASALPLTGGVAPSDAGAPTEAASPVPAVESVPGP